MKPFLLVLFLLTASCRTERSVDLIALIPFAETSPDTEVLLFSAPKSEKFLVSWSEPKRQSGGRFRWSISDHPALSWNLAVSEPAFLHLRTAAMASFPIEVRSGNSSFQHWVDGTRSSQMIPLKENATSAEFRLPGSARLGVHSAVISRSRHIAEFRKPRPFPDFEKIQWRGKKRNALVCETGGAISFYEAITPETVLEFGYYFTPATQFVNDTALFSLYLTGPDQKGKLIFQRRANQTVYETARIPLRPYVNEGGVGVPHKLEFRIARDTAFGDGKTAWIEPRLQYHSDRPKKPGAKSASAVLRKTMDGANVLLIILDAASVRRFGSYGYSRSTTPEIDEFRKEGAQFLRAYTNAVYTLASTATTLTGQLPIRHGVLQHRNRLPAPAITLPEKLQESGYETAAFLANGNVSTAFGLTQGFHTLREVFRDKNYVGRAEDITETFLDWLNTHENRHFFAYLHYREPHDPYQPPVRWVEKFTDPSYQGVLLRNFKEKKPIEKNDPALTAKDREFISSLYDANLAYGDSEVGKVLRALKDRHIYNRTMIIVTSDHGEAFWEHGYQGHNLQLYEESTRVPMIIKFPQGSRLHGTTIPFPVQHADLFSTLVELLGMSSRGVRTDGVSIVPWLTGEIPSEREILLQSTRRAANALVLGDYKFIQNNDGSNELYNLTQDPMERKNLVDAEYVRAGYLRQLLLKKLDSAGKGEDTTEPVELDDAARENLKALGYLD